jgi:calpain-5
MSVLASASTQPNPSGKIKNYIKECITTKEEEWRAAGAFRVKFYRDGEEETVIIDDKFPVIGEQWAFVKGG